jgi:hypothetical protein
MAEDTIAPRCDPRGGCITAWAIRLEANGIPLSSSRRTGKARGAMAHTMAKPLGDRRPQTPYARASRPQAGRGAPRRARPLRATRSWRSSGCRGQPVAAVMGRRVERPHQGPPRVKAAGDGVRGAPRAGRREKRDSTRLARCPSGVCRAGHRPRTRRGGGRRGGRATRERTRRSDREGPVRMTPPALQAARSPRWGWCALWRVRLPSTRFWP